MYKKILLISSMITLLAGTLSARVNDYGFYNWSIYPLEITIHSLTGSKSCVAQVPAYIQGTGPGHAVCETTDVTTIVIGQNCLGTLDIRKVDPVTGAKTDWHIKFPVGGCYSQNFTIDANGLPFAGNIAPAAKPGSALDFKVINDEFEKLGNELKVAGEGIAGIGGSLLLSLMEADEKQTPVKFCPSIRPSIKERPIHDQIEISQDTEKVLPLIKEFSPILKITKEERAWPISAAQLFSEQLAIKDKTTNKIIVQPATPAKALEMDQSDNVDNYQFVLSDCLRSGGTPKDNYDAQGHLTTPVYVFTYENPKDPSKLYLVYAFLYAFNYPYDVRELVQIVKSPEKANEVANAHDFDLEHLLIEIDKKTQQPTRIFFGAHGSDEGFWLPFNSPEVSRVGTHPIVYVARGGHGVYNKPGSYVRIFGFANDNTSNAVEWDPQLVRIYPETDPRFDKNLHGWASLKHLWNGPFAQTWWFDLNKLGRPYNAVLFCPLSNPLTEAGCKAGLAPRAIPPHGN